MPTPETSANAKTGDASANASADSRADDTTRDAVPSKYCVLRVSHCADT